VLVLEGTSLSRCSVGAKYFNIKPSNTRCDCRIHVLTYPWDLVILQFYHCNVLLSVKRTLFEFYDLGLVVFELECKQLCPLQVKVVRSLLFNNLSQSSKINKGLVFDVAKS
jgi:hypothetical protein